MGDLEFLDDYRIEIENATEDAKTLTSAMAKYLQRADSVTGLLPSRDSEGRLIMVRTVRAVEWREFTRKSLVDVEMGEIKGVHFENDKYIYYITQRGRKALEEYVNAHS